MDAKLFTGGSRHVRLMFGPESDNCERNDDTYRNFEESMPSHYPRRIGTGNKHNDRQGDARISIGRRNTFESNPITMIAVAKGTRVAPKKFASIAPVDAPTAVATIRSIERLIVAPKVDCITTKVAIEAQYASGIPI